MDNHFKKYFAAYHTLKAVYDDYDSIMSKKYKKLIKDSDPFYFPITKEWKYIHRESIVYDTEDALMFDLCGATDSKEEIEYTLDNALIESYGQRRMFSLLEHTWTYKDCPMPKYPKGKNWVWNKYLEKWE